MPHSPWLVCNCIVYIFIEKNPHWYRKYRLSRKQRPKIQDPLEKENLENKKPQKTPEYPLDDESSL